MNQISELFKLFYSRFLLRDIFSFVLPGLIILSSFTINYFTWTQIQSFFSNPSNKVIFDNIRLLLYILLFGVSYLLGYGIQCFSILARYDKYFSKGHSHREEVRFTNSLVKFSRQSKDYEKEQRERFIILKQLASNNSTAIIISFLLLIPKSKNVELFFLIAIFLLVSIGLKHEGCYILHRRERYERKVIKEAASSVSDNKN